MRVSNRHAAVLAAIALGIAGGSAQAQMFPTGSGGGNGCCAPPPPPPPTQCCIGGPVIVPPTINIGGPQVNVGVNVNTNVNVGVNVTAQAQAQAGASARASNTNIVYAGGGGVISGGHGPSPTALSGLAVASAALERYEEQRTRMIEGWRLVRAVCVDDSGTPHPASRIDPEERVDAHFDGEIYRCMAGTALHATIGWREDGEDVFDGGETITCRKGEALRHRESGELFCATASRQRNCYERSLLRLHGPGVKLIYQRFEEHYTEMVERMVERRTVSEATLMLDGGVGGWR